MKEEHGIVDFFNALRLLCLCLIGVAIFSVFSPKAHAAQPTKALPKPGQTVGFFDSLLGKKTPSEPQTPEVKTLVPVGHTVGIKLFSDGVLVVGLGSVDTAAGAEDPAKRCGLKMGDIITHIDSREVDTIEEVQSILAETSGREVSLRCLRGDDELELTAQAARCSADGCYKLGAWIRDSMAGIGTVTFVDPETGLFGALGHPVSDVDTQRLMPLSSGAILHSSVTGVQKGQMGQPGQLRGAFDLSTDMGALFANTESGIFGTLNEGQSLSGGPAMAVATRDQVHVGKVTVRTNIQGDEVRDYEAEIVRIYPEDPEDTRNFLIKITDPELLEKTGGIVQGMSGSPILQDGRLVGAVTHVLVNDPTSGYGILVENMLKTAQEAA